MNKRLSLRQSIIKKIVLAVALWMVFSLPGGIGFLDHLVIGSNNKNLVLLQRAIQLVVFIYLVLHFWKEKEFVAYNDAGLVFVDKRNASELTIPYEQVTKVKLEPTLISGAVRPLTFRIFYRDSESIENSLTFSVYAGKTLSDFRTKLGQANHHVEYNDWTFD